MPKNTMEKITKIKNESLIGFNPKQMYPAYEEMEVIGKTVRYGKLGKTYKLIESMLANGAVVNELEAAVRHFIVLSESEKNGLNYKQSYLDNGIGNLTKKYQNNK